MNLLYNKYSEFRSGWKIFLTVMLSVAIGIGIITLVEILFIAYLFICGDLAIGDQIDTISKTMDSYAIYSVLLKISTNVAIIIAVAKMWKVNEKTSVSNLGLINVKEKYKDLIIGLVLGAVTISIVAMIITNVGGVQFINKMDTPNIVLSIISGLILFISIGIAQEVLTRGYYMSVLKQARNKYVVLFVPAILFAIMSLGSKGMGIIPFINLCLMGITFAYMFVKSKSLWMPIGFHIMWSYIQGYVFGFNVSGEKVVGLYEVSITQSNLINGGTFGPEGGLVVTGMLLLLIYGIRLYYKDLKIDEFLGDRLSET
ncbi:MAG: CPBP family intramembrane glutamic endopeptidase [Clostridium sp.]